LYGQQNGAAHAGSRNNIQGGSIMKKNIGGVERVIRIIAGAGILSLAFVGPQSPWAYLGIVPLATGLMGWCPPYALFGFSTCKTGSSCSTCK
jgi:DUF2892 family protein